MLKITYIFPTRERKHKAFAALDNIHSLSASEEFEVILVMDIDDAEMNSDEIKERLKNYPKVRPFWGVSANKVSACNRQIADISPDASIICLHSDDMKYLAYGFDTEIREAFRKHFPDLDGVIHFNDGHQNFTMTYTMMGINLFKQLGYLYHPNFESVYCDNHLTEMTKKMGKYAFVNENILLHEHPIFHLCEWDPLYKKNEAREYYQKDRETFLKLQSENFEI